MPVPTPAQTYESFMVPFRFRPWAGQLLDRLELSPGMKVLDVACGTGIVARTAAGRLKGTGQIVGIDMNPSMIEVAAEAAAREGFSISWEVGKAESLPYPDGSFDLVTIQQGLQFFPDKVGALRECFRVLVPGGTLAVGIWSSLERQGIQKAYAEAIERVTGAPSMHAPYGAVTPESLQMLLEEGGFGSISLEEVTIELTFDDPSSFIERMVESTSAGVPTMHSRSEAERRALSATVTRETADAVRAATVDGRLVTKSTAYIATGARPPTIELPHVT
jgi:ubiquinone/menaquinone biosynthesis C-methylase UbiE